MMKGSIFILSATFLLVFLLLPGLISARHLGRQQSRHAHHSPTTTSTTAGKKDAAAAAAAGVKPDLFQDPRRPSTLLSKHRKADTLQIAGSSLPDCSHACGSCTPCRLVMVSFVCASLQEAETCPIAYKCMCRNKSYPVP